MFDDGYNRRMFPVSQGFSRTELDPTGYRHKKSYLVDEHDVNTQCHITVLVHYRARHVLSFDHNVFSVASYLFSSQRLHIGSQYIFCRHDIFCSDEAVLQ